MPFNRSFNRSFNGLSCNGSTRDAGDPNSLTLCFNRPLDDEEMRRLQEHVKVWLQGHQPAAPNSKDFYKT